jgi:nucleoid-associated protein YgaU
VTFQQAYLVVEGTSDPLMCWFNPPNLNVTQSARWQAGESANGTPVPQTYLGGQEQALTLALLFHADGDRTGADVSQAIKSVQGLLEPVITPAGSLTRARPPTVEFVWGSYRSKPAVCTSVAVSTELFDQDGTPLRAVATITLANSPAAMTGAPTNPTTKATHRRRAHEVAPGENLALIAQRHYRDPTRWREIAELNALDDPLRVAAPTILVVPLVDA